MISTVQISAPTWVGYGPVARKLITVENGRITRIQSDRPDLRLPGVYVWDDPHLLIPAFHDAHAHLLMGGFQLGWCHFADVRSREQFADTLRDYVVQRAGESPWIQGNGLNEAVLRVTRDDVDRVCSALPVFIWTHDLHSAVVNSKALEIAGTGECPTDPPAGRFERDSAGRLTGVLRESAAHLVARYIPLPTVSEARTALLRGQTYAFSLGITAVSSSERADGWPHYFSFFDSADYKIRVNLWRATDGFDIERDRFERARGDRFRAASLKGFVDGALGSRTAAMWQPYDDDRSNTGILSVREGHLARWVRAAHHEGFQVALHAIGDRANTVCLDAIEMASSSGRGPEYRPRIEHAQFLREQDIPRFAAMGVVASMQPIHCTSDMGMVEARIGTKRARTAYAWRSLLNSGTVLAFGSDWPVETLDPLAGVYAAVTRSDANSEPRAGWMPQERITCEQALRAYTYGSSYAAFWEKESGVLEEGKCADFTVLSRNIFETKAEEILRTEVVATFVGGELVYEAKADKGRTPP